MSLVIIDQFWNSSAIQATLLQLPTKSVDETSKESICLSYDTLSTIQLIVALVIVKIIICTVLHLRYWKDMTKNLFHIKDVVQILENNQKFLVNDFRANVINLCRQPFPQLPHDLLIKLFPKKPMVVSNWLYRIPLLRSTFCHQGTVS